MDTTVATPPRSTTPIATPRSRTPIALLTGAVLTVILMAGALIAILVHTGSSSAPSENPARRPVFTADQQVPTSAPRNVAWHPYYGVDLPYSPTAGPAVVDGPVARDFTRTPVGALLAAEHIAYRRFITPGDDWRRVTELQVLPGPGRDRYVAARSRVGAAAPPGGFGQIAGFRFVTYTPDVAVIQVVTRFPDSGALQMVTATVRWADGDWRLQLQPDGSETPTAQPISALEPFIPWSGDH